MAPVLAAPKVPEKSTSNPRFGPALIPDTISLGVKPKLAKSPRPGSNAHSAQSAGVPPTAYTSGPRSGLSFRAMGWRSVSAMPAPERSPSGATTTHLIPVDRRRRSARTSRPGASTPSSFDNRRQGSRSFWSDEADEEPARNDAEPGLEPGPGKKPPRRRRRE